MPVRDVRPVLAGWAGGTGPLYRQLADAVIHAIECGDLADGDRLPAERQLASLLAVSRTTVTGALALVKELGLLAGRVGHGTTVTARSRVDTAAAFAGEMYTAVVPASVAPDTVHLTSACQPAGDKLRALLQRGYPLAWMVRGHGYHPQGVLDLRSALAASFTRRGLPTTAEQLVVTTGAQQALSLVASLYRPGTTVLTEELTYPGAVDAFRRRGLILCAVGTDAHGVVVDDLREQIVRRRPDLLHLSPSVNNPTGAQLPAARRGEIAALADEADLAVLEDNTLELLMPPGQATPPLAAYARTAPVYTIGSLSKSVWGGLRVGWIRTSAARADALTRAKAVADLGSPTLNQHLAVPIIDNLDEIAAETRVFTRQCLRAAQSAAEAHLPRWQLPDPEGGLSCWVRTDQVDTDLLAQHAQRNGVVIAPESLFRIDGQAGPHLRLPLVHAPATVELALRRLAAAAHQTKTGAAQTTELASPARELGAGG